MGFDTKLNFVTDSFIYCVYQKYLELHPPRSRVYGTEAEDGFQVAVYARHYAGIADDFDYSPWIDKLGTLLKSQTIVTGPAAKRIMNQFMVSYCSRIWTLSSHDVATRENYYVRRMAYQHPYEYGPKVLPVIDRSHDYFHGVVYDGLGDYGICMWTGLADFPHQVLVTAEFHSENFDALIWENELEAIPGHMARLSKKFPGSVSFFESEARMKAARRLCMKPGKYLTKFYPELDPDVIRAWAAKATNFYALQIATTADDIERVYMIGPDSCMSKGMDYYDGDIHPTRAYAGPDLALAYIGTDKKATARALVWPDKKLVGRIYGDYDRLIPLLRNDGYSIKDEDDPTETYHTFDGARLSFIKAEDSNRIICPYVDGIDRAWYDGEYLVLGEPKTKKGEKIRLFTVQSDCGLASERERIWVADLGEYRSNDWVSEYCVFSETYQEWVYQRNWVVTRLSVSTAGNARRSHDYVATLRLGADYYYCMLDNEYYMNSIPHTEVGDYKVPLELVEKYKIAYGLKEVA